MILKFCKKHNIFYGWVIVLCGIAVVAVSYGTVLNCFSLYVKPVTEQFGYTRQSFSASFTIINILVMIVSLFAGSLFSKYGLHKFMKIAAILLPASYFSYSFCESLLSFYICSAIAGISMALISILPFTIIISNWFQEKRGFALGLCFMGTGLGGMLFNAIGGRIIATFGWECYAQVMGICIFLITIPSVFFFLKIDPKEIGETPLGFDSSKGEEANALYGYTAGKAFTQWSMWALILIAMVFGGATYTLSSTVVPHISDLGFDAVYAANFSAICLGGVAVGKVLVGSMFDKFGMRKSLIVSIIAICVGLVGLYFGNNKVAHVLIFIGSVIGIPASTVSYPGLIRDSFGTKAYAQLNGIISSASFFGVSIAPLYVNAVYDNQKSYNNAYFGVGMIVFLTLFLLLSLKKYDAEKV